MTPSKNTNTGHSSLENINTLLTPPQVSKFIQKAVPELKLGQASLKLSLESEQWKSAAKQAHRLKSTISLFLADNLVNSLDLIESGDQSVIQTSNFKQSFEAQCQRLIDELENYFANG